MKNSASVLSSFSFFARSKRDIFLSSISIFLGAFFFTFLFFVLQSAQNHLQKNAATTLGGDIKIQFSGTVLPENLEKIENLQQQFSEYTVFSDVSGMLVTGKDEIFTAFRAVDEQYPLYGSVKMQEGNFVFPNENEIFLETSFSTQHSVQKNDQVQVGDAFFVVVGFFETLPDVQSSFAFLGKSAVLSQAGLQKTGLKLQENRSSISFVWKSPENFLNIESTAKENFPQRSVKISTAASGNSSLEEIFSQVQKISLSFFAGLFVLFFVSFFMGIYFFLEKQKRTLALLKCLGMDQSAIVKWIFVVMAKIFLIAGMTGTFLAIVLMASANFFYAEILPFPLLFSPFSFVFSIVFLLFFPFFAVLFLSHRILLLSPALLLKGSESAEKTSQNQKKYTLFLFGIFLLFVTLLLGFAAKNMIFSVLLVLGMMVVLGILFVILRLFFGVVARFSPRISSPLLRYSLLFVAERGSRKFFLLGTFFVLFFIIWFTSVFSSSFFASFQNLASEKAPSVFFIDIQKEETEASKEILQSLGRTEIFSIIRAPIASVNDEKISENAERGMSRAFNIAFQDSLLADEKIASGTHWQKGSEEKVVSVESQFAAEKNISLGDRMVFSISGREIAFVVVSLRQIPKRDFNPWFIFTFPENALPLAPSQSIAFFWSDIPENIASAQKQMVKKFPSVSAIATNSIQNIVAEISALVSSLLLFMTGLIVLASFFVMMGFSFEIAENRKKESKLFFRLGASQHFIQKMFWIETFFSFFLPFLLAFLLSILVFFLLRWTVFDTLESISFSSLPFVFFGFNFALFLGLMRKK